MIIQKISKVKLQIYRRPINTHKHEVSVCSFVKIDCVLLKFWHYNKPNTSRGRETCCET